MKHTSRFYGILAYALALVTFGHYGSFTYNKNKGAGYQKRGHTQFEPMNIAPLGGGHGRIGSHAQKRKSPRKRRISPAQRNVPGSMRAYTKKRMQNVVIK
jgi:hypothetical protein